MSNTTILEYFVGMNINPSPSNSVSSTPVKNFNNNCILEQSVCEFVEVPTVQPVESSCSSGNSSVSYQNQNGCLQRIKHPHNIPYHPLVHTNNKPPYSFSCLIFMAIEDSVQKALPVKEIYTWILDHFPYFKNAPTGWKNSVRHNLSLNKCFQKVEKAPVSSIIQIFLNSDHATVINFIHFLEFGERIFMDC